MKKVDLNPNGNYQERWRRGRKNTHEKIPEWAKDKNGNPCFEYTTLKAILDARKELREVRRARS